MGKMKDLDIDSMNGFANSNDDPEQTDAELKKMMKELNIKNEAEFKDKILEDWDSSICPNCLQEVKLIKAVFINDAPYHKWCAEESGEFYDN